MEPVVFRWDLDKTYLLTEFESLREMVRIPFEKAEQKITAPGVVALIRGLREVAVREGREIRIYFVSASPPQIGKEIKKKLDLDGITYDGIVFKDQLHRIIRGKFRHLREQVGYKLTELLKARVGLALDAPEYLFGDDWESDPLIYSLYADVLAGHVDVKQLRELLSHLRVDPPLVEEALELAAQIEPHEAVRRIFINLERRTPPRELRPFGMRLVPSYNYLQTAACLFADGVLDAEALVAVARSLAEASGYGAGRMLSSLRDLERRGHLTPATRRRAVRALESGGVVPPPPAGWRSRIKDLLAARRSERRFAAARPSAAETIDYRSVVLHEEPGANR